MPTIRINNRKITVDCSLGTFMPSAIVNPKDEFPMKNLQDLIISAASKNFNHKILI